MATTETEQLRGLTDGGDPYTDAELQTILDAQGSTSAAARYIWRVKAAATASMVDVSESGSTRALGNLHKQALTMAASFSEDPAVVDAGKIKRSRPAGRR